MICLASNLPTIDSQLWTTREAGANNRKCFLARCGSLVGCVLLLNFAYAPYNQFYLAHIALVPLLLALRDIRLAAGGFFWGFLTGVLHFAAMLTWLWTATIAGTVVMFIYLGLFWGVFGLLAVKLRLLDLRQSTPFAAAGTIGLLASLFVAKEWIRSWLFTGFGWTPLGQTQSPFLAICQFAEFTGIHGLSFLLLLSNGLIYLWISNRQWKVRAVSSIAVILILLSAIIHGSTIIADPMPPNGPKVMLVQPNFPHERGGARTVTQQQQIDYHFPATHEALSLEKADLVVWSETVMPPMNVEVRRGSKDAQFLQKIHADLLALVQRHRTSLVFGAYAVPVLGGGSAVPRIHNSTYLYAHDQPAQPRYDKIHLVPFGEIVPFRDTIPWAYRLFMRFAAYSVDYTIDPGPLDGMTVYRLNSQSGQWNFVTPICFEDIDGALVARMLRGPSGKRADFLVNITNDGWFNDRQKWQELQSAVFRCIENRVPMARCSNTGISAFIDPAGRIREGAMLPLNAPSILTQRLSMSARQTFYTRYGDLFALICTIIVAGMIVLRSGQYLLKRRTPAD